jgi:WD40 repeat protein
MRIPGDYGFCRIAFGADGEDLVLAGGPGDGAARLLGSGSKCPRRLFSAEPLCGIEDLACSTTGLFAATASRPGLWVWDLRCDRPVTGVLDTLGSQCSSLRCVAWAPDGNRLAVWGFGCGVVVWDVSQRKLVAQFDTGRLVRLSALAFVEGGRTLVAGGAEPDCDNPGVLWVWDVGKKELRTKVEAHEVNSIAVPADGKTFMSAGQDGTVWLWDVTKLHLLQPDMHPE